MLLGGDLSCPLNITGKASLDGLEAFHAVLLDNHCTHIHDSEFREFLHCSRCGACMHHCTVYQTVSGHAYERVYPGPQAQTFQTRMQQKQRGKALPTRLFSGNKMQTTDARWQILHCIHKALQRQPGTANIAVKTKLGAEFKRLTAGRRRQHLELGGIDNPALFFCQQVTASGTRIMEPASVAQVPAWPARYSALWWGVTCCNPVSAWQ